MVTTTQIDLSDHSDSIKTETRLPQQETHQASTKEELPFPTEEVLPVRLVTWNVEEKTSEEEETLSRLGRRKVKALKKKALAEKKKEEDNSWKLWFWSLGCPCWNWSPMYIFKDIEDQSTMATSKCDQSSMATSTFYTLNEDDDSSIPSCSRIGSTLDHTNSIDDEHISDVSSNSSDGSLNSEMNEKATDVEQTAEPSEVYIVKDWSREGLSKNTIMDMDVYMAAMRD